MPDLESLLGRLIKANVEFVIVGGYAAVAHGVTLVTQDMDICCRFSVENLMRLQGALADLHPEHRMTDPKLSLNVNAQNAGRLKNLYLTTDWGQLDCIGTVLGLGEYDDVQKQSQTIELDCGRCQILTVEALIRAKMAMDRPRDREAVVQLKAIKEAVEEERTE